MAVLCITHKFPPSIGGMQKQSFELIRGLQHSMECYHIIQSPTEPKWMFFLLLFWRVKRALSVHPSIEVIHCNDGVVASYISLCRPCIPVKITATLHGLDLVFPNVIYQKIIIPLIRKIDKIIVVSQATYEQCLARGFSKNKLQVIHNGIDKNISPIPNKEEAKLEIEQKHQISLKDKKILVSVGRPVKRKGFSWFIESVLSSLPEDVIYILVGPELKEHKLSKILRSKLPKNIVRQWDLFTGYSSDYYRIHKSMKHHPNCIFLTNIGKKDLFQILSIADIYIMPNIKVHGDMEGFGLVALEAAMCGTYVIASKLEGITCAIQNGKNGELLPSSIQHEWVSRIRDLLLHEALLESKSKYARKYVMETFDWKFMVQKYQEAFEGLYHVTSDSRRELAHDYI